MRLGAWSAIAFAVAGLVWIGLEIAPVEGLVDGDNPALVLAYLRDHPQTFVWSGVALLVMAITLSAATFAVADALRPRADSTAVRTASAVGLFAAVFLLMFGVMRLATGPLLYIDSLNHAWGEAAFLVIQMVGVHGFAQAGVFALCLWAVGISAIALKTQALPLWLGALGVIPLIRIVGLLGPLGVLPPDLPDFLWPLFMASIPGVMAWCFLLGLVLLRAPVPPERAMGHSPRRDATSPQAL
jgi:hypothetical protein